VSTATLDLRDQVTESEQIAGTREGAPARDRDIRIECAHIGPIHRHRGEDTGPVVVKHAQLAPRVLDGDDFEGAPGQRMKRMGNLENSLRGRGIDSN
jgi:hypothetical protein